MAKKDDILTAMVTMRLREDAALAYRSKSPAERRDIMQALRDRLDELLAESQDPAHGNIIDHTENPTSLEDTRQTDSSTRRRPPIPND